MDPTAPGQPSTDRLALLYNLSQQLNSSLDLDEVLNKLMDEVVAALHAERGFIMLSGGKGRWNSAWHAEWIRPTSKIPNFRFPAVL